MTKKELIEKIKFEAQDRDIDTATLARNTGLPKDALNKALDPNNPDTTLEDFCKLAHAVFQRPVIIPKNDEYQINQETSSQEQKAPPESPQDEIANISLTISSQMEVQNTSEHNIALKINLSPTEVIQTINFDQDTKHSLDKFLKITSAINHKITLTPRRFTKDELIKAQKNQKEEQIKTNTKGKVFRHLMEGTIGEPYDFLAKRIRERNEETYWELPPDKTPWN